MVGVPGKYKGCNTCRLRRVKCDNERPFCRKCVDSGRECAGYERETVFIIGTIEDGGRCSSHPPRVVKSKKAKAQAITKTPEVEDRLKFVAVEPLRPAWDDLIAVSVIDRHYQVQLATLNTSLQNLIRAPQNGEDRGGRFDFVQFPPYEPHDPRPVMEEEEFELRSQALVHLSPFEETWNEIDGRTRRTESICMFLYDHNNSVLFSNQPPWRDPAALSNSVRQQGPEGFRSFPNHHFFIRVYRPNAICAALLNRKPIFLSGQEWITTPWEFHPRSFFDQLFDTIVLLPTIFARADHIFPHDPTMGRRLAAQDLLGNCLSLEAQFNEWIAAVNPHGGTHQPSVFWIEDASSSASQIPFADTFAFVDGLHALMFIYYWTALVLFYPCISALHEAIFHPVVDAFPQVYPTLPAHLQTIDPLQYCTKEVRELVANVCRSLDFALSATVQPDMLVVPLFVVEEFYREINAASGNGQLELMWCESFRQRLAAKGQDIAEVVQGRRWQDLASW